MGVGGLSRFWFKFITFVVVGVILFMHAESAFKPSSERV
ncbi:hypothetical protein SEA_SIXAMA_196 [Gordonia phage Sixama]|uniref:Uncharacterized protein n=1 Tax=Gordonia phage Sixama TaxID=2653271 RepID=A0A5Q2F878_9CAUD|nr:hypothetical protein PP302_gp133 [Gordonia phage Sixama]QGF20346.1 hypothetical protein SEA_SIXAMA_196 [Gordonia phage Sixama]